MTWDEIQIKGSKIGYCNICNSYGKLTCDHIPPKGCLIPQKVELISLQEYLSLDIDKNNKIKSNYSQNGLNYRSICGTCNNTLLGTNYDPELINTTNQVASILKLKDESGIILPKQVSIDIKPQKLARAVIGHILAGQIPDKGISTQSHPCKILLKNFLLDTNEDFPDDLEIYYWIYPSNKQVVINNLAKVFMDDLNNFQSNGRIPWSGLLKFYPLSFWIVWKRSKEIHLSLQKIPMSKEIELNDSVSINLHLNNIPHIFWPEGVYDDEINLYNSNSAIVAKPANKGFKSLRKPSP